MNETMGPPHKLPPIESFTHKIIEKPPDAPVYSINNTKYVLPPRLALQPYMDTKSGELDTWPAHAGAQGNNHVRLVNKKNLTIVQTMREDNRPQKPRFLAQLETFLSKELTALNATTVEPSEVRLQAHREVFEYLIEDFRSYRPLLSAIKNEYEMMISNQRQQIHELEPLKQILVTVSEQCDRKIMALRDSEKENINDLKKANQLLQNKIASLNNEGRDLQEQVVRLQEELGLQYEKYRNECDARKLLIADMNNLRYQQEDHILSQDSMADLAEEQHDDPTTLKIALKQARQDEKKASERLNDMIANYGDVIPRRDHEIMEKQYVILDQKHIDLTESFQNIQMEYNALLDLQSRTKEDRDKYYLESEEMKRSATPRPDWEKCGEYVEGGPDRWRDITKGKSSADTVDVLLKEISAGGINPGGVKFFDGRGTGEDVPEYLRFDGPVKNRHLSKRDCLLFIMEVWREKVTHDSESEEDDKISLEQFLGDFFKRSFPVSSLAYEWGYNIHDACVRFNGAEELIGLFWDVLNNEVDEEVYHRQLQTVSLLLTHFSYCDTEGCGEMSKEAFKKNISLFFLGITEDVLAAMCQAAEKELEAENAETLSYKLLFMEDDEGHTGPFLEAVKKFKKDQKLAFIAEILEYLEEDKAVTEALLKQALSLADPHLDTAHIDQYTAWVFKEIPPLPEDSQEVINMPKEVVETRLKNGDVWKMCQMHSV